MEDKTIIQAVGVIVLGALAIFQLQSGDASLVPYITALVGFIVGLPVDLSKLLCKKK